MRTLEQTTQEVLDLASKHFHVPAGGRAPAAEFLNNNVIDII
jgi:hypothetical protein